jgi:hypothetical protein
VVLAGLRLFNELKTVESNSNALHLVVLGLSAGIFLGATHASRLGLHRHSREGGNPEAGQTCKHNKMMKMRRSDTGKNHHKSGLFFARGTY